jgi:hypothetical protein
VAGNDGATRLVHPRGLKPRHLQISWRSTSAARRPRCRAQRQPAGGVERAGRERGVGVALFERSKRGLTPTVYGECLIRLPPDAAEPDAAGDDQLPADWRGRARIGVPFLAVPVRCRWPSSGCSGGAARLAVLHEATADRCFRCTTVA